MTGDRRDGELDALFSALGHRYRRHVYVYLARNESETFGLEPFVDAIVRREEGAVDDRRRVRTALHHLHLPKLEEAGVLVYERDRQRVRQVADETLPLPDAESLQVV